MNRLHPTGSHEEKKRRRWPIVLGLLLVLLMLLWMFWPDRRVAAARALQQELFGPAARQLTPEQRRDRWEQLRTLTRQLSPEQRLELSAESRKRQQAELARYFRLPPAEKVKYLDEQINRMERLRQARASRNATRSGGATAPASRSVAPRPQTRTTQSRDDRRQRRLDATTPAERAQTAQFRKELAARRAQRGLPAQGGFRGFGPSR